MSARVDSSAGRVERWLTQPFERAGWRGVARRLYLLFTVGATAWGVFFMVIASLAGRLTGQQFMVAVVMNAGVVLAGVAAGTWVIFRDVATYEAWDSAGRPTTDAQEMLRLVLTSPFRTVSWATAVYLVVAIPTIYAWLLTTIEPPSFAIVLCVGGLFASTLVAWPVVAFIHELSTRPVIARIGAEFPHLAAPEGHGMSLRTRALLPVPGMTLTTGIMVGALAGLFDDQIEQLGAAIVVSLAFTGMFALILRVAVTEAALRPVDDLIDGVKRVASGDLGSRVPITSSDELAVLGRGVNEMTERLAAHDADMRASRARIVAASDEARRSVERDLHDGAQQYLVLLELELGLLTKKVADDPEASASVAKIRADLGHALAELRDLAHGIYPAVLESDGLPAALQAAADRSSMPVTVNSDGVGRYAQELEAAIYFCCLEALQNSAKHAGDGAKAWVRLSQADGHVQFEVGDDGIGYDEATIGASSGLQNMADRSGALGGELQIESTPGAGTTVRGAVPIEAPR
ncbi:MAG: HAMP domain-containing protein [Aeromicrobium sp.]